MQLLSNRPILILLKQIFRMGDLKNTCFVCKQPVTSKNSELNLTVNLPVCKHCKGTKAEQKAEKEALDSLADGFVCGCI
nr:hypothetical protein [uncultured Draconibacterium sp.]